MPQVLRRERELPGPYSCEPAPAGEMLFKREMVHGFKKKRGPPAQLLVNFGCTFLSFNTHLPTGSFHF